MKKYLYIALLSSAVLTSCEKAFLGNDGATEEQFANFEKLWKECDERYSYFDLKGVDWDQVYVDYKAQIRNGMSEEELFEVLGSMLTELEDDHTNLFSDFNVSVFGVQYNSQDNYDSRIVRENYLTNPYMSGTFLSDFLADSTIGYIRFSSFTGGVGESNIDYILNRFIGMDGIILDLRENGGGPVNDVFALLSRFADQEKTVFYTRIKNGPGHNDFSAAEAAVVAPRFNAWTKKVALLTDRGTYSSGSLTTLGMKAFDHVKQFGDTTGGGLGTPNGGQLPNGWSYRFSVTQTLDLNMDPQWEQGVPPDSVVLFDWDDRATDEILEAAIDWIQ